jgi:hypothetical protein
MLKEDGKVSNKLKRKRHKTQKCSGCRSNLDIDSYMERNDFDRIDDNTITVYCEKCGNPEIVKL